MSLFQLEHASCERDAELLFRAVDIDLGEGEWLLLEGANGIGKSTLLRALVGLYPLNARSMNFAGVDVLGDRGPLLAHTRWLGHALAIKRELSVIENLRYALGIAGRVIESDPHALCALVGLTGYEDSPVRTLSAGQKKRVALLPLIASSAKLWLLDEPFANLDTRGITLVHRLLQTHLTRGGSAVIASHGDAQLAAPSHRLTLVSP